nr:unnamed protein product [Spirometra erinaceieuropaei]
MISGLSGAFDDKGGQSVSDAILEVRNVVSVLPLVADVPVKLLGCFVVFHRSPRRRLRNLICKQAASVDFSPTYHKKGNGADCSRVPRGQILQPVASK